MHEAETTTRFGMIKKLGFFIRLFFVWIYARVVHEPTQIQEVLSIPDSESIVYVLGSENKHDFLYLNDLCLKHNKIGRESCRERV